MSVDQVRFDTALPVAISYVQGTLGLDAYDAGVFVRDGFGRLSLKLAKPMAQGDLEAHASALAKMLGSYASQFGVIANPTEGTVRIDDPDVRTHWERVNGDRYPIRLVERRFFGQDWLNAPVEPQGNLPPLLTFGSLKGGVGRSTALFLLAMRLAALGRNILIVDLDLEAPGLGALALTEGKRPKYGVVDYLVEIAVNGVPDASLPDFVATSPLTDRSEGNGRVDIVPAAGDVSLDAPQNMLAKLSRALLEMPSPTGPIPLSEKIRSMLARFHEAGAYDAILIDARAGLAELTAAPLLSLGSTVALFGTDHPHTFEGYRYLLAHLSTLPVHEGEADWRERIRFVHAKASASTEKRSDFDDKLYDLVSTYFYEEDFGEGAFTFSFDDVNATHKAWRILFSDNFVDFDPVSDPELLSDDIVQVAYGDFLNGAIAALGLENQLG